jgi:hypothetical protein
VEDKSYLVALPFNVKNPVLPNERRHYKTTAGHILRRFKRNPGIFKKYNDQIEEYRRQGFIEKLGPEEARSRCEFIHYDPHHPVIRLDKNSTKVRIVFNTSFGKPSLKDILESGQNLTPAMSVILIRFPSYKYGITADTKKAFLQLRMRESDTGKQKISLDH